MRLNLSTRRLFPYLMISPAVLYLAALLLVPIVLGILTSFFRPHGLLPGFGHFVGLQNYVRLAEDTEFWHSLLVTLEYTVGCLVGAVGVGLGTAVLLNKEFPGRGLARALMTAPWAMPEVAAVLIWIWMMDSNYGVANSLARHLHLIAHNIRWLNQVQWAMPAVLIITVWKIFPLATLVILTALQAVPDELLEAAEIDGANSGQSFWHVTLPLIRPTLLLISLLITVWSLKRFTVIWLTTQGGPVGVTETLPIMVYRAAFKFFDLGYAATIGTVGLLVSLVFAALFVIVQRRFGTI